VTTGAGSRLAVELIQAKRQGLALADQAIQSLFEAYLQDQVAEEQMAALLMAICWRGMSAAETRAFTDAMIRSGTRLELGGSRRPTVDKHSTGGVGDKVSLVLVPLVAACGAAVPQLSGRGLGHTGGTLDKLDSIPGWRSDLGPGEILRILDEVGCVICAAGPELAPADRRLYALRDRTATVDSIPLIASSIMAKKVAEGTGALLLDVKVGRGAFMATPAAARALARAMISLGRAYGVKTEAVLTAMDTPLGRAVGNAMEVAEALDVLRGDGPPDVHDLVITQARTMLRLAGIEADPVAALASGRALDRFRAMVIAQGGDPDAPLPQGARLATLPAARDGHLVRLDARQVGTAAWRLGAGRSAAGETVSATAGIYCRRKPGERVTAGEPILELFGDHPDRTESALAALEGAVEIAAEPRLLPQLVLEHMGGESASRRAAGLRPG